MASFWATKTPAIIGAKHFTPPPLAGLTQHSTSPWASPVVVIPKKYGGIRITVNYKKLNKLSILGQFRIPLVHLDWGGETSAI